MRRIAGLWLNQRRSGRSSSACASTRSACSSTTTAARQPRPPRGRVLMPRVGLVDRRFLRRGCGSSASTTSRTRSDEPRARRHVRARRRRGAARLGRGRHPARAAGLHRRRAGRQGGARGARAGARRDHRTPASSSRRSGSPSTSRRPTCARSARASTCRSRSRSWPPAGSSPAEALAGCAVVGELSLTGEVRVDPRRARDRRGRTPPPARRGCCSRAAARARRRSSPELEVLGVEHLQEAVEVLRGEREPGADPRVDARTDRTPSTSPISATCAATTG